MDQFCTGILPKQNNKFSFETSKEVRSQQVSTSNKRSSSGVINVGPKRLIFLPKGVTLLESSKMELLRVIFTPQCRALVSDQLGFPLFFSAGKLIFFG